MTPNAIRLVMASANSHKVAELEALFRGLLPDLVVLPRPTTVPEVVEDADSLIGNARLKAWALMRATGMGSVADDTGLFVDALGGQPGVRSARFAGEHASDQDNVSLLLRELQRVGAVDPAARSASFRTVAMVVLPDGTEVIGEGRVEGAIGDAPIGSLGFGYDPVFIPRLDGNPAASDHPARAGRTFAQMSAAEKNAVSHRARACADLAIRLHRHLAVP